MEVGGGGTTHLGGKRDRRRLALAFTLTLARPRVESLARTRARARARASGLPAGGAREREGTRRSSGGPFEGLSRVGLGTMLFGTTTDREEAFRLLDRAVSHHGVNLLDTAEMYPVPQSAGTHGLSEVILGDWFSARVGRGRVLRREDVVVATKVTGPSGQMPWIRGGPERLDAEAIIEACEGSLARLGLDHVDILQLHWPDRYVPMFGESLYRPGSRYEDRVPLEEQMEALGSLVRQGKVRRVGLSNETPWGLTRCCDLSRYGGFPRIHYLQNSYSLLCRTFDCGGLAECCWEEGVELLAYSPLAMGLLTGKYLPPEGEGADLGGWGPPGARLNLYKGRYSEAESRYERTREVTRAVARYGDLAGRHGMTLTELAVRFVLSNERVGCAVLGATSCSQLDELLDYAGRGALDSRILDEIDGVHRAAPNPTP